MKYNKKAYAFTFLNLAFLLNFLLFTFQRSIIFKSKNFVQIDVFGKCNNIDIFYVDKNSEKNIVYCHGSILSGKVFKKLIYEMANMTCCNVISFNIRGMFNNRGEPIEADIYKELDQFCKFLEENSIDSLKNKKTENKQRINEKDKLAKYEEENLIEQNDFVKYDNSIKINKETNKDGNNFDYTDIDDNNTNVYKPYKYTKNNTIIFGQSLGCCLASYISKKLDIKKTIVENPFINYKSAIKNSLVYKHLSYLVIDNWDNIDKFKHLNDVLFLVSTKDDTVSNSDSFYLSKLSKQSHLKFLTGNNHFNSAKNENYYKYIKEFIRKEV